MWNSQALVFDLDDTLYAESTYFCEIFKEFCSSWGWPNSSYAPIIQDFDYVRKNKVDIFGFFLEQNKSLWGKGSKLADSKTHKLLHESLFVLYKDIQISLMPREGVSDWMGYAYNNSLKVGVLTNGVVEAQINKWRSLDFIHKDSVVFVPARICGTEKPSEKSLAAISNSLDYDLEEITFIGDNFENDLAYPLSKGATGIFLSSQVKEFVDKGNWFIVPNLGEALSGFKFKRK